MDLTPNGVYSAPTMRALVPSAVAVTIGSLLACASSSTTSDPCAEARNAQTAFEVALAAAVECTPAASTLVCRSTAGDRCGCVVAANDDPARHSALLAARQSFEKAVAAEPSGCAGSACPAGCPGAAGSTRVCIPSAADPTKGVCALQ
jgi:hypothetical protein